MSPQRLLDPNHQRITATTSTMVKLRRVKKVYENGVVGLENVSLTLKTGEFLFLTGDSGAGKSTLLKILYGAEKADFGSVWVNGYDLSRLEGDRLSRFRRSLGVVFQDYKLIPRRTVAENLEFVLRAQGLGSKEIHRRLHPTLKLVGLNHKANCFPAQLSGGEQQRISLARAIVNTPPLIIADEPTGNLDPDNAIQVLRILQKLHHFGATVIVATHDERLVMSAPYPVLDVRHGRVYQVRV